MILEGQFSHENMRIIVIGYLLVSYQCTNLFKKYHFIWKLVNKRIKKNKYNYHNGNYRTKGKVVKEV